MMVERNCEVLLLDYAAGSLDPAQEVIVAAYLTLSPEARRFVARCEEIGGAMLEQDCSPAELSADCLEKLLAKIDCTEGDCRTVEECGGCGIECCEPIPTPLARLFPDHAEKPLQWKSGFKGMKWITHKIEGCSSTVRIMRTSPGFVMPHHAHTGVEITLILDGAMEDQTGRYVRGDLYIMEEGSHHEPVADREAGCLCCAVNTKPIRLTGFFTRLLNRTLR